MKKLRLDLDEIEVEGFTTSNESGVVGHETGALCVEGDQSWDGACGGDPNTCSCQPQTCANTCFHSCYEPDCYGSRVGEVTCAKVTVCDISCTGVYPNCC